jgi:hypothetical protein
MILVEGVNGSEEVDGRVRSFDDPECRFGGGLKSACSEGAEEDQDGGESSEEVHRTTFRDGYRIAEMGGGGNTRKYWHLCPV